MEDDRHYGRADLHLHFISFAEPPVINGPVDVGIFKSFTVYLSESDISLLSLSITHCHSLSVCLSVRLEMMPTS